MFKQTSSFSFGYTINTMDKEYVILVDKNDTPIGEMEKIEAHEKALLHRAFSVFVFNDQNELLLQKRASSKYHSGGLWTNTCCSHQRREESSESAAHRRLQEEMGFVTDIKEIFSVLHIPINFFNFFITTI